VIPPPNDAEFERMLVNTQRLPAGRIDIGRDEWLSVLALLRDTRAQLFALRATADEPPACTPVDDEQLHREEQHSDFEYATTRTGRKTAESLMPDGDGWEPNNIVACHRYQDGRVVEERWRNWERFEFHENEYWRRRKPAPDHDALPPSTKIDALIREADRLRQQCDQHISTIVESNTLALPRDAVTSTIVVYGGKGMGKTNLASVLVEEFAKQRPALRRHRSDGRLVGAAHDADGRAPASRS
jgi:hypothetical protein